MQTLLARNRKRVGYVRRFHVAEFQRHVRESRRDCSNSYALVIVHARPIGSNYCENDVLFVQDLVVLEIVKERGWSQVRGAGQEYRCAWHNRGGFFSRLRRSTSSGTSVRRVLWAKRSVPLRHVMMSSTMLMPNRSGTHAPSRILSMLAERNVASTITNGITSSAARHSGQRHHFQMMMKPSRPSATMVVATAMP